jgi:4-hydroxybenzoate polyprenyltransferase
MRTGFLVEGALRLVRADPRNALRLLLWSLRGRSRLAAEVARRVDLPFDSLPVQTEFLAWLRAEKAAGRRLVLCPGAWRSVEEGVARRFGGFDDVVTDDPDDPSRSRRARNLVARFGEQGFDYAGGSALDLPVWEHARAAIIVEPTGRLGKRSQRVPRVHRVFPSPGRTAAAWLRALRVHQWSKNVLVFVPALASHRLLEPGILGSATVAFVAFSLAASGNYLLNDLLDLDADRAHASKRGRALASGDIGISAGLVAAVVLIAAALALGGSLLGPAFLGMLAGYLAVSLWYSVSLKRLPMVDIICLAALYTIRVIAGGVATAIEPSFWLLAFSMFLFLSLAAAKRVTELNAPPAGQAASPAGRGYDVRDLPLLVAFGVASGYLSVLVLALYVGTGAEALYSEPRLIWLVCPLLLYWISRIWLRTHRGTLHEDPVVFALTDRPSLLAGALAVLLVALAV